MVKFHSTRSKPRKRINFLKSFPILTLALYAAWFVWVQSTLRELPTNKKYGGRVYCCITGQVQRLILKKKVETLLTPLQRDYGYVVDIALVLTDSSPQYSNPENGLVNQPEFDSFESAKSYLENHVEFFKVVSQNPINTTASPPIPQAYFEKMDKTEMPSDWQKRRVANHARQFETLQQCYEQMPAEKYDFIVRIRDDMALEAPLQLEKVLPLLKEDTVLASDCRTHGGMNDRLAIVSPNVAQEYFERPHLNFESEKQHAMVHNPESYLYYNYQEPFANQKPLKVINTKTIRGIVKYVTNFKGVAMPADKEDKLFCPKPWSLTSLFGA